MFFALQSLGVGGVARKTLDRPSTADAVVIELGNTQARSAQIYGYF